MNDKGRGLDEDNNNDGKVKDKSTRKSIGFEKRSLLKQEVELNQ